MPVSAPGTAWICNLLGSSVVACRDILRPALTPYKQSLGMWNIAGWQLIPDCMYKIVSGLWYLLCQANCLEMHPVWKCILTTNPRVKVSDPVIQAITYLLHARCSKTTNRDQDTCSGTTQLYWNITFRVSKEQLMCCAGLCLAYDWQFLLRLAIFSTTSRSAPRLKLAHRQEAVERKKIIMATLQRRPAGENQQNKGTLCLPSRCHPFFAAALGRGLKCTLFLTLGCAIK